MACIMLLDYTLGYLQDCIFLMLKRIAAVAAAAVAANRIIYIVQNAALVVFSICWVAIFDYIVYMFTCDWGHTNHHLKWKTESKHAMLAITTTTTCSNSNTSS